MLIGPPEGQASITIEPVPAEIRGLELFAGYGLNEILEDRRQASYFYLHAYPAPPKQAP